MQKPTAHTELQRNMKKVSSAYDRMAQAHHVSDLRDAWEEFLFSHHRTIGKMITIAMSKAPSRAWGHQLKNLSTKDDEGLVFLREARAQAEHGVEPFADFHPAGFSIANVVSLGAGSQLRLVVGDLNGERVDAVFTASDENTLEVEGQFRGKVSPIASKIKLLPIKSLEKRKTFPVPKSLAGNKVTADNPMSIATAALTHLRERELELVELV